MPAVVAKAQPRGIYPVIYVVDKVEEPLIFKAHIYAEALGAFDQALHAVDAELAYRRIIVARRNVIDYASHAYRSALLHVVEQHTGDSFAFFVAAPYVVYAVPRRVNIVDHKPRRRDVVGKLRVRILPAEVQKHRVESGSAYLRQRRARVGVYLAEVDAVFYHSETFLIY